MKRVASLLKVKVAKAFKKSDAMSASPTDVVNRRSFGQQVQVEKSE